MSPSSGSTTRACVQRQDAPTRVSVVQASLSSHEAHCFSSSSATASGGSGSSGSGGASGGGVGSESSGTLGLFGFLGGFCSGSCGALTIGPLCPESPGMDDGCVSRPHPARRHPKSKLQLKTNRCLATAPPRESVGASALGRPAL